MGEGISMIDIPSGYDWYDGSKVDDLKNTKADGRGVPSGGVILETGVCAS